MKKKQPVLEKRIFRICSPASKTSRLSHDGDRGFRTRDGMDQAIAEGIDILGLARTVAMDPSFPKNSFRREYGYDTKRISPELI